MADAQQLPTSTVGAKRSASGSILTSQWDGLSDHLIARFYPVQRMDSGTGENKRSVWIRVPNSVEVRAPISDGNMDNTATWTSPFENTGVDQRYSAFSALVQAGVAGELAGILNQFIKQLSNDTVNINGLEEKARSVEGKSGVTKLNSVQVFTGQAPGKITVTAHFSAHQAPYAEVQAPINQLIKWTLSKKLADEGMIIAAAKQKLSSLYPSDMPQIIAMQYAGMVFSPLVIEAAPYQFTGPRDSNGRMLGASVQLTMGTLSAIDANDWDTIHQSIHR